MSNALLLGGFVWLGACGDDDEAIDESFFVRTDLVASAEGFAANVEPDLIEPWGVAAGPDTFLWVANRGSGTAAVFDGEGDPVFFEQIDGDDVSGRLIVDIPIASQAAPGTIAAPLSIVHNPLLAFEVPVGGDDDDPSEFIFGTENGALAGWTEELVFRAELLFEAPRRAAYTGLALSAGLLGMDARLYAVDFRNGIIDVFDEDLGTDTDLEPNAFIDPGVPSDLSPFAIEVIDGEVFVSYARVPDSGIEPEPGAALGAISRFELDGELIETVAVGGPLNAPVSMVETPDGGFGPFGGDTFLVANSGDGRILVFDEDNGDFIGVLTDETRAQFSIRGLHGLEFGNDDDAGDDDQLFFTASIDGVGLLGRIESLRRR